MNKWNKILIFLIPMDIAILWYWVYKIDPNPSVSIGLIIFVPLVFMVNISIAGLFYFFKKRQISKAFMANSIVSSIVMYALFVQGIQRHQNRILENWEFNQSDTTYQITRYKENNEFYMTERFNPGSSFSLMNGTYIEANNEFLLTSETHSMTITKDNRLIGFPNFNDTISMNGN